MKKSRLAWISSFMENAIAFSTICCRQGRVPGLLGLTILLVGIAGCAPKMPSEDLHTPSPVRIPSREPPTAQATPSPTSKPTLTPTPSISPTQLVSVNPTATPSPLACWLEGGEIEIHRLYTDLSPWPWEYRIYTPPCYDSQPNRRYPVLYLIHGSTYTDDQWDRLGADEVADRLIGDQSIPPFLIVMPRDRAWVEPTEDPFGDAVVSHLIPWVDANYRTLPDRAFRAIGGLSRGASWAVHLGISQWELFGAIGAHSLPVFWSDTPKIRGWLKNIPEDELPRIYLDIGEKDYLIESAIWFENVLNELDIPHEWYLFPGRHEEAYWQAHLESYLRWYTQEW